MHLATPSNTISNIPKARFEVKGPSGTQNLPAEKPAPDTAPAPALVPAPRPSSHNLKKAKPSTKPTANRKLQELIKGTGKQEAEIVSLRKQIAKAHAEIKALSESKAYRRLLDFQDQRIAALEIGNRIALRAAGLAPSRITLDICPIGSVTNPAEAYAAAVEAGDKQGAAEIFAAHKTAIFSSRK
jgi:hypothetical protein